MYLIRITNTDTGASYVDGTKTLAAARRVVEDIEVRHLFFGCETFGGMRARFLGYMRHYHQGDLRAPQESK
jgi:hypothetical protein